MGKLFYYNQQMPARARVTQTDPEFMIAIASALRVYRDGLNPQSRILTDSELAHRLGVSKASITKYLQQKQVIGGEAFRRLLVELAIPVVYDGTVISARPATHEEPPSPPSPEQISFVFEGPCVIDEAADHVTVSLGRKQAGRTPLRVELKVAS
jgi:transcriptional regulator with XRE-family HTH domain